jgi:sugar (pentulose or hexulose) kinase
MEAQAIVPLARMHAITGHAPPYIFPLSRFLWYRKHHDVSRVATLLMLNDWIAHRLSGARMVEESNACESMLFDVTSRTWSGEILDALDVPRAILPPVCVAGTEVGRVTATAAAATGLPEGTPVLAGGADTESALLGGGALDVGTTGAVLGTTTPVQQIVDRAVIDPGGNLWTSCHVVPDRWVLESNGGDTGGSYRWLLELLYGDTDFGAHSRAEADVAAVTEDGRHVVAHIGPGIFNLSEMNPFATAGIIFRFPIMHLDRPTRGDLLRGFFESVAFAIRGNCEQIVAVSRGHDRPPVGERRHDAEPDAALAPRRDAAGAARSSATCPRARASAAPYWPRPAAGSIPTCPVPSPDGADAPNRAGCRAR